MRAILAGVTAAVLSAAGAIAEDSGKSVADLVAEGYTVVRAGATPQDAELYEFLLQKGASLFYCVAGVFTDVPDLKTVYCSAVE